MKGNLVRLFVCGALLSLAIAPQLARAADQKNAFRQAEKHDLKCEGKISAIDATAGTVTVNNKQKGPLALTVAKDCMLFVKHKKGAASLADFKVGEEVKALYSQDAGALVCHSLWQPGSNPAEKERKLQK